MLRLFFFWCVPWIFSCIFKFSVPLSFFFFPSVQLDKKLLKAYFNDHPRENLPDFADKVLH